MAILRAQSLFPFFTGIPRDVISNTMHFDWDEVGTFADAASVIAGRLSTFYDNLYDDQRKANYVVWSDATVEVTNLEDPSPRIPEVRDLNVTGTSAASNLPTEVAMVLTYAAAETGGVVRQRLYNRIYIGGLGPTAMSNSGASAFPVLSQTYMDELVNSANALLLANDGAIDWIQYSPTSGTARPITRGWVDNSPDTQRRRSVEASAKTPWL